MKVLGQNSETRFDRKVNVTVFDCCNLIRDQNCAVLDYYVQSSGNFIPTFGTAYQSLLQGSRLFPYVSKKLPLVAA
jgi:hypothetical protein